MFTKKEKALISIFTPLCIILFIFYSLIISYKESQKAIIIYPEGTLSDSLFVSQNNTYTENEKLPNKYACENLPYYIDIPNGTVANVGNGNIIQMNDVSYAFISEYTSEKTADTVMLEEFPSALLIDFDSAYTYSQNLKTQAGYINGFAAQYYFNMLSVSNGNTVKTAYIAAYELRTVDTMEANPNRILLGVITTNTDTGSFTNAKGYLDMMTMTVRYDKYLEAEQEKAEKRAEEEAEANENKENEEKSPEESKENEVTNEEGDTLQSITNADSSGIYDALVKEEDEDVRIIPIAIDKDYKDLFVNIKVDKVVEGSTIMLYTPELNYIENSVVSEDGLTTQFQIGEISEDMYGNYILKITHYSEYGKVSAQKGDAE